MARALATKVLEKHDRSRLCALACTNPSMTPLSSRITVVVCDTQPVTAEGLRAVLSACPDLEFMRSAHSLASGAEVIRTERPKVALLDKAFGIHGLVQWMADLGPILRETSVAVWGVSINETEALRFIQAGAKGVIRKTADTCVLLNCLRTIAAGSTWMEDSIFRDFPRLVRCPHSDLTPRELQVLSLVEHGMKNQEIARELGIRPGTVKIHLKHIFEKTGVRGRHGLALSGLRERGALSLPS